MLLEMGLPRHHAEGVAIKAADVMEDALDAIFATVREAHNAAVKEAAEGGGGGGGGKRVKR